MAALPLRARRDVAVGLLRSIFRRRLSTLDYVCKDNNDNETNPSFIHPSSVVRANAILGSECFLQVGDNNEIREHVSIHRSSKPCDGTVIVDNNLIMGSCHRDHDCKVGRNNIFANNTLLAGHVLVEDHALTAGAIVVHQFCHIVAFCFIGGGSVVSQDVPKYTMVAGDRAELRGLNIEGLRRGGFSVTEIRSLRAAYRKIFMPTNSNIEGVEDRLAQVAIRSFFFATSLTYCWRPSR